jgi:hypothetical protein
MAAITPQPAYGFTRVHFVKEQNVFDTHEAMAATDGVRCIDMKITPSKAFEDKKEGVNSPSKQSPLDGKRGGKWNAKFHLMPTTSGTPPDAGPFIKAAMGAVTGSTYSLASVAFPLQLAECMVGELWQEASGACVEQLDIDVPSGESPTMSASGSFARYIWAMRGSAAISADSQKVVTLTAGHDGIASVDAYVDLTGAGNTNRQVTAVTPATPSFTVDTNITTALGADSPITPYCPTPTIAGNYIPVGLHALTVDAVAMNFISFKLSIKTGFHLGDKEASADRANKIFCGPREVTGEIQAYFFDAKEGARIGKAWDKSTHALSLRIGEATTAKRLTIAIPAARFEITPIDAPEAEETLVTIKFVAQMNAASNDEITSLLFD